TGRRAASTVAGFISLVLAPTFFTMTIAGIWHGAGLQFLIFGLLHACYLCVNHAWRIFGPKPMKKPEWFVSLVTHIVSVLLTISSVIIAQIFFRADSTSDAFRILLALFGEGGLERQYAVANSSDCMSDLVQCLVRSGGTWKHPVLLGLLFSIVWLTPNAH